MKKVKQISAIIGIIFLLSIYAVTVFASIVAKPYANTLFIASLYSTIVIPIFIYGFMIIYKAVHKHGEDVISIKELKKKCEENH